MVTVEPSRMVSLGGRGLPQHGARRRVGRLLLGGSRHREAGLLEQVAGRGLVLSPTTSGTLLLPLA